MIHSLKIVASCLLPILFVASSASAAEPVPRSVCMHVTLADVIERGHQSAAWGVAVEAEHGLEALHLDLFWAGHYARHGGDHEFTESLGLKHFWHVRERFDLFAGMAGMMRQHTRGDVWSAGVVATTGGMYRLENSPHWGVVLEAEYIEDFVRHTHELGGVAGVVYHFGDDHDM